MASLRIARTILETDVERKKLSISIIAFLTLVIIAGSLFLWFKYFRSPAQEIIISLPVPLENDDYIYIGGAVANPGLYPLRVGDDLDTLLQAAGGVTAKAGSYGFALNVSPIGMNEPQRVDINRAEVWLLQALPGIGETRAKAIIDYRSRNGMFRNINELTKVEGIGLALYEQVKGLITIED